MIQQQNCPPERTWFTADTHFDHRNIMRYCNRPFSTVEEMNDYIIEATNKKIGVNDCLYHLGDFAFSRDRKKIRERINYFRGRIRCKNMVLIAGNHDPHNADDTPKYWLNEFFSGVYQRLRLNTMIAGKRQIVILDHYAGRVWNHSHHSAIQLFGHSHGSLSDDPNSLQMDVGVDCHNFEPINLLEIVELMKNKQFVPVDHHTEETL